MLRLLMFLPFYLGIFSMLSAQQKYGHLNLGNLLLEMPETKEANAMLEAYQNQLVKQGEKMAEALQKGITEFQNSYQLLSPVEAAKVEQKLQADQQKLLAFEREVVEKVGSKRQELLGPIIEKAQEAIRAVGKENGYSLIFDTSAVVNGILFTRDSENVLDLAKNKLGI